MYSPPITDHEFRPTDRTGHGFCPHNSCRGRFRLRSIEVEKEMQQMLGSGSEL
jgi:hypothetical protein